MPDENENEIKYCEYCGAKLEKDRIYCPKCGKLAINARKTEKKAIEKTTKKSSKSGEIPGRECPECGSIIRSRILKQCPVCNAKLKEPPPIETEPKKEESGFIFTGEKLQPLTNKNSWNLREGLYAFGNSIAIYFIVLLTINTIILDFIGTPIDSVSIVEILVGEIPEITLGIYPLFYIISRGHKQEKLGLNLNSKTMSIALILGIAAGMILYFINYGLDIFFQYIIDMGFDEFLGIQEYYSAYAGTLKTTEFYWIILFTILLIIQSLSSEILFRGTLHNSLKDKFGNQLKGKVIVILIVALIISLTYSILFFFVSLPIGIYFFVSYLILNLVLGCVYEINGNLANSMVAYTIYNLILLIMMLFF
ncbi:MAG: CPBP family glutamic-type intramembrane protease [Promethearchaeati archaeon]